MLSLLVLLFILIILLILLLLILLLLLLLLLGVVRVEALAPHETAVPASASAVSTAATTARWCINITRPLPPTALLLLFTTAVDWWLRWRRRGICNRCW